MTARRRRLPVGPGGSMSKKKIEVRCTFSLVPFSLGACSINTFFQLVGVVVKRRGNSSALRRDMVPETVAKMLNLDLTVTECGQ